MDYLWLALFGLGFLVVGYLFGAVAGVKAGFGKGFDSGFDAAAETALKEIDRRHNERTTRIKADLERLERAIK